MLQSQKCVPKALMREPLGSELTVLLGVEAFALDSVPELSMSTFAQKDAAQPSHQLVMPPQYHQVGFVFNSTYATRN